MRWPSGGAGRCVYTMVPLSLIRRMLCKLIRLFSNIDFSWSSTMSLCMAACRLCRCESARALSSIIAKWACIPSRMRVDSACKSAKLCDRVCSMARYLITTKLSAISMSMPPSGKKMIGRCHQRLAVCCAIFLPNSFVPNYHQNFGRAHLKMFSMQRLFSMRQRGWGVSAGPIPIR